MESESEWQLQPDPLTHWTGSGIKPAPEPLQSILNPEPQQEPLVVGGLTCIQPGIFCGVFLVHINTAKIYHWEVVETLSNCTRGKEAGDRHFCASKGYFFFIFEGKHLIIVFFTAWKEEWIRNSLCAYLLCFPVEPCHVKEAASLKKNHQNVCDWLFPAWHLVATWKNCSFWPMGGNSVGNHRRKNRSLRWIVLCTHASPWIL